LREWGGAAHRGRRFHTLKKNLKTFPMDKKSGVCFQTPQSVLIVVALRFKVLD
jgi:hypothetical protein